MNWLNTYKNNFLIYDLVMRCPLECSQMRSNELLNLWSDMFDLNTSFSKSKDIILHNLVICSFLSDLGFGSKVSVISEKVVGGKKFYRFSSRLALRGSEFFFDFFLHVLLPNLKRKYLNLRISQDSFGRLVFSFQGLSEMDLDDFSFFDLHNWTQAFAFRIFSNKKLLFFSSKIQSVKSASLVKLFNLEFYRKK